MAEQKQDVGGLSAAIDYSKLPLFGASEKQLESLRDAQQQAITALEQRYAQPNLFKVSEAFLKPQLGGFAASLGSAMGAMGENTEQQRAQQLPISQMRAQLAQSNLVLGSSVSINEEIKKWMSEHQGQTPPASLVMEWNAKAPQNPTVQSLVGQQKMTMEQQAQQLQTAKALFDSNQISREEYGRRVRAIEQLQSPQGVAPAGKPVVPTEASTTASATTTAGDEKKSDKPSYYPMIYPPPTIENLPKAIGEEAIKRYTETTASEEKRYLDQLNQWGNFTIGPNYSQLANQFETATSMIKEHPEIAKKVFNLLRGEGGLKNQILAALNKGIGININGAIGANINFPVGDYLSSGLSETEQNYADRLVNAMLNIGNTKLALQNITPASGQQAYFENLLTKASITQNPATAYNILANDHISFRHAKDIQDTVLREKKERKYDPNSLSPTADIFANSPDIAKIEKETAERYKKEREEFYKLFPSQKPTSGKPPVAENKPATSKPNTSSDMAEGYIKDKTTGVIRRKRVGE